MNLYQDTLLKLLQKMPENEFTKTVLLPLFKALGFFQVEFHGGPSELGKDLICWRRDELKEIELTVAQVKRYKPSRAASDSRSFSEIVTQICQCIESRVPYTDGNTYLPSTVYFVTPYDIDTHTLSTRFGKVAALKQSRVKILDGPKLALLLEERVPEVFSQLLGGSHKIGKAITPHLSNHILMSALGFQARRHIKDFYTDIDIAVGYVRAKYLLSATFTPSTRQIHLVAEEWRELNLVLDTIKALFGVRVVTDSSEQIEGDIASARQRWNKWKEQQRKLNNSAQELSFQLEEFRAKIIADASKASATSQKEASLKVLEMIEQTLQSIDDSPNAKGLLGKSAEAVGPETRKQIDVYRSLRVRHIGATKKATAHQSLQPSLKVVVNVHGSELINQLLDARHYIRDEAARLSKRMPTSKELKSFLEYCHKMFLGVSSILENLTIRDVIGFQPSDELAEYTRLSLPVNVVFDTGLNVCVLGEAGAGKTTALQMYAYKHYESAELSKLVIFAPLAAVVRLVAAKENKAKGKFAHRLDEALVAFLQSLGASYTIEEFRESASRGGILLLDSVDEAYATAPWIIDELVTLSAMYPQLQLIASSRVSGEYVNQIPFVGVRLMPFTDEQQETFISNWFGADSDGHIKTVSNHLKRHPEVAQVVRNPLLATAMCALQEHNVPLPTSEIRLYQEWLSLLIGVYDAHKSINRIQSPRHHLELLAQKLAFYLQLQGRREDSRLDLERVAAQVFDNVMDASDANKVLSELMHPCNILVPMAWGDRWGFGHLRYQEYLAASELCHNRSLRISRFIESPWWKGVLMLFAQMHDSIDWIVDEIADIAITKSAEENLLAMLEAGPKRGREDLIDFIKEKRGLDDRIEEHLGILHKD
jgi:hypothetical protein